jgi:hypothetical protein
MPRVVISKSDDLDRVERELTGDYIDVTELPLLGGSIIVLGRVDFAACYGQHVNNAKHVPEVRDQLQRALSDNKQLSDHLKHVQGRCTEYLEETRQLKREIARLENMLSDLKKVGWE